MEGDSAIRGASVRVELPSNVSAPPDVSFLSEPSNTSVQGPATSIMLPEEGEGGGGLFLASLTIRHSCPSSSAVVSRAATVSSLINRLKRFDNRASQMRIFSGFL